MTVRRGESGDLTAISALEKECFTDPWSEDALRRAFSDGISEFAVIEDNDGMFGYALFSVVYEDAEIMSVAVAPTRRRCGAGRALMEAVLRRSAGRGATRCFLEVRESNAAARAMYTSLGFSEIRRIKRYYRRPVEDAVVMLREIEPV